MKKMLCNKKVTLKRVRPNPLFEDWVEYLYEQAKAKKDKLEPVLKEALDSLSKYPVPLNSGAECMILKGFDKVLCMYLDKCLKRHNSSPRLCQCNDSCDDQHPQLESTTSTSSSNAISNGNKNTSSISTLTPSTNHTPDISTNYARHLPDLEKSNTHSLQSEEVQNSNNSNDMAQSNSPVQNNKGKKKDKTSFALFPEKLPRKKNKPAYRSGGYAILVALLEQSLENMDKPSLTKDELIEKAQKHAEESFVRPKPDSFYTAWSNMTRLVTKGLVTKIKKKEIEYLLTEEGKALAREIMEDAKSIPSTNDIIFNDAPSTSFVVAKEKVYTCGDENPTTLQNVNLNNSSVIEMPPGTFDIVLLIDKNETGGHKKKNYPTVAQFNKYADLKHEYRSLKVGDFTWVAKSTGTPHHELVLPYVVERKRMDDLGASIKDGRFHEQKFRLRKCGLTNVIYMVENYGKNKHVGLPIQSLMQALANTRVQDGFKVHVTDSLTNSARFLAMMTKRLTIRYKDKHLRGHEDDPRDGVLMTFDYFNKSSAKTKALTVTETFIKLLLQLKGVSVEKALAITNKYPTPRSLIQAYRKCDRKEGEILLAHLKYSDLNRNVGPIVSKSIYQLFSPIGAV